MEQNLPLCRLNTSDEVYAYITSNQNNDGNNYFYLNNNSANCFNTHTDLSVFSDSASGECIVERPGQMLNTYFGLADFHIVGFRGCYVDYTPINSLPHFYHNMVNLSNNNNLLASVGPVANNNTDYSVYWHNWV